MSYCCIFEWQKQQPNHYLHQTGQRVSCHNNSLWFKWWLVHLKEREASDKINDEIGEGTEEPIGEVAEESDDFEDQVDFHAILFANGGEGEIEGVDEECNEACIKEGVLPMIRKFGFGINDCSTTVTSFWVRRILKNGFIIRMKNLCPWRSCIFIFTYFSFFLRVKLFFSLRIWHVQLVRYVVSDMFLGEVCVIFCPQFRRD